MSKIIGVTVGTTLSAASVANALKGTVSGESVVLNDISPLPHEIKVKVSGEKTVVREVATPDNGSWSNEYRYGDYVVESIDTDIGDGRLWFTDGSYLTLDMAVNITVSEINIGDTIRFSYDEEDEIFWYAYLVVEGVADVSSVTLTKQGKNLLDISKAITEPYNSAMCSFVDNGNGTYTLTKKGQYGYRTVDFPLSIKANTTIAMSGNFIETPYENALLIRFNYADGTGVANEFSYNRKPSAFTPQKDVVSAFLYISQGNEAETRVVMEKLQIEIGTATEYEPYKEPETVSVKQDGTASIIGKGEGITLMTDTEGVTITAEYNRDLNKAFAEIYQAIATMGAAAVTIPEEV